MQRIQFYIDESMYTVLGHRAEASNRSRADLIREAIDRFLGQNREKQDSQSVEKSDGIASLVGAVDLPPTAITNSDIDRAIYG